jgi:hypothetical protein
MPFTPFHIGPGIFIKAILQSSFSLMVFGWTQVVMDIQPLIVLITGEGHLHGFTHTYIGATILAVISAISGKYLSQFGLVILGLSKDNPVLVLSKEKTRAVISKDKAIEVFWWVAFLSAFIGSFSHVYLDSIMHADVQPFYPLVLSNHFHGLVSISTLHKVCLYSGLFGGGVFYAVVWRSRVNKIRKVDT